MPPYMNMKEVGVPPLYVSFHSVLFTNQVPSHSMNWTQLLANLLVGLFVLYRNQVYIHNEIYLILTRNHGMSSLNFS